MAGVTALVARGASVVGGGSVGGDASVAEGASVVGGGWVGGDASVAAAASVGGGDLEWEDAWGDMGGVPAAGGVGAWGWLVD